MNFAAEEFDAGASLHVSQPASQPRRVNSNRALKREAQPHLKSELNVI
jgi:hypothetical protein